MTVRSLWACGANFLLFVSYKHLNYQGILIRVGHTTFLPSSKPHSQTRVIFTPYLYFTRLQAYNNLAVSVWVHIYIYVLDIFFNRARCVFAISSRKPLTRWQGTSKEKEAQKIFLLFILLFVSVIATDTWRKLESARRFLCFCSSHLEV